MTSTAPAQSSKIKKATAQFMFSHPAHILAQGFGSGLSRIMPGTAGTLLAWLIFDLFSQRWPDTFTPINWFWIIVTGFLLVSGHVRSPEKISASLTTAVWSGMRLLRSGWFYWWSRRRISKHSFTLSSFSVFLTW